LHVTFSRVENQIAKGGKMMRRHIPENKKTRKVLKLENKTVVKNGIGFGSVLAITISWSVNHSILWAIIHGCLSWLYVVYYALVR